MPLKTTDELTASPPTGLRNTLPWICLTVRARRQTSDSSDIDIDQNLRSAVDDTLSNVTLKIVCNEMTKANSHTNE